VANIGGAQTERRVPIQVGPVDTTGDEDKKLAPQELARLIRAHLIDIRLCYERALKRRPELSGKLLVRFTLTAAGTVSGVAVDEDTMGDAEVAACVRSVVGRWRFPAPPRGGVEVSFPFVFQAAPFSSR
jgi:TonB family protein